MLNIKKLIFGEKKEKEMDIEEYTYELLTSMNAKLNEMNKIGA